MSKLGKNSFNLKGHVNLLNDVFKNKRILGSNFMFDVLFFLIIFSLYNLLVKIESLRGPAVLISYYLVIVCVYSFFKLCVVDSFSKNLLSIRNYLKSVKFNLILFVLIGLFYIISVGLISGLSSSWKTFFLFLIMIPAGTILYLYSNIVHFGINKTKIVKNAFFSLTMLKFLVMFDFIYLLVLAGGLWAISFLFAKIFGLLFIMTDIYVFLTNFLNFAIIYVLVFYNRSYFYTFCKRFK